jgi:phosphatidylglycerophosphatase A
MHEYYFSDFNLIAIHLIFSFLTFRFFDITKPSLIGRADSMKSGVGVILDDILAGIAAALTTLALLKLTLLIR